MLSVMTVLHLGEQSVFVPVPVNPPSPIPATTVTCVAFLSVESVDLYAADVAGVER